MRRRVTQTLGAVALLTLLVALAVVLYGRRSLPVVRGTTWVTGLSAAVDITRDAHGVPHIQALTRRDAFFGLGYVHAQDRLWQMEFQRRIAHGRLSEVFGAATVGQDRFLRTLGTGRAARAAWNRLPVAARLDITAYTNGVNAFIDGHRGSRLPPEFTLLGVDPEPWTGPDVLGWVKMMAWDLSANYSAELLRHDLASIVGIERTDALMPPPAHDALAIIDGVQDAPGAVSERATTSAFLSGDRSGWSAAVHDVLADGHPAVAHLLLLGGRTESLGSNSWVVSGRRTRSGAPLLANDPHLGTRIPSVWYLARLSGADGFMAEGATLPGAPGVAIGRNASIAWGLTNVAADVQDFYLERLDDTGTRAEYAGAFEPIRAVHEVIDVRDADPMQLQVRVTRHGPLVSDAINANAAAAGAASRPPLPPLALRWTALEEEDTTVLAFLGVNQAHNWTEFTEALRHFVVPSQNFVYADREGHIGYYAPGWIPVRARGDGRYPASGWTGDDEWLGWIPFSELPHLFDPPSGVIVTANNRPVGGAYPYLIGSDFPEPYRARRIVELLGEPRALTADHFAEIQRDTQSLHARELLPVLLGHLTGSTADERRAIDAMRRWDFDAGAGSGPAPLFHAWFLELVRVIAGDDLGPDLLRQYLGRYSYVTRFLLQTLGSDRHGWCDDQRTGPSETCSDAVRSAFRTALSLVTSAMGADPGKWRWGAMHRAVFPHQGLDAIAPLRWLLSRSVPGHGDWSTVNVGPVAADRPFEQRSIASYRQIVDLSADDDSRFQDAVGQSGHVASPHYDDLIALWSTVEHLQMRRRDGGEAPDAGDTLRLVPASPAQ